MNLFQPIDGTVVLYTKGHYNEAALFTLNDGIYAQHARGFIRLKDSDNTSAPGVYWRMIETPTEYTFSMGKMIAKQSVQAKMPRVPVARAV